LVSNFKGRTQTESENTVLMIILFEPQGDEVTGDWRKLHNEELHNLYSSPSTIRIIKSRRMRWAGHVAPTGKDEYTQDFCGQARGKETTRRTWT
jgi:hypothetical protein